MKTYRDIPEEMIEPGTTEPIISPTDEMPAEQYEKGPVQESIDIIELLEGQSLAVLNELFYEYAFILDHTMVITTYELIQRIKPDSLDKRRIWVEKLKAKLAKMQKIPEDDIRPHSDPMGEIRGILYKLLDGQSKISSRMDVIWWKLIDIYDGMKDMKEFVKNTNLTVNKLLDDSVPVIDSVWEDRHGNYYAMIQCPHCKSHERFYIIGRKSDLLKALVKEIVTFGISLLLAYIPVNTIIESKDTLTTGSLFKTIRDSYKEIVSARKILGDLGDTFKNRKKVQEGIERYQEVMIKNKELVQAIINAKGFTDEFTKCPWCNLKVHKGCERRAEDLCPEKSGGTLKDK
jgi:hypothetical protein